MTALCFYVSLRTSRGSPTSSCLLPLALSPLVTLCLWPFATLSLCVPFILQSSLFLSAKHVKHSLSFLIPPLSLSLSLSPIPSLVLSPPLTRSLPLPLSLPRSLALSLSLSLSPAHSLSRSPSLSLSPALSRSLSLFTLWLCLSHSSSPLFRVTFSSFTHEWASCIYFFWNRSISYSENKPKHIGFSFFFTTTLITHTHRHTHIFPGPPLPLPQRFHWLSLSLSLSRSLIKGHLLSRIRWLLLPNSDWFNFQSL